MGIRWSSAFGLFSSVIDDATAFFFVDMALKSFILLVATICAARLLRSRSAATVHRLWALAYFGLIIVPIVGSLLPTWSLSIIPKTWSLETARLRASVNDLIPSLNSANALQDQQHAPVGSGEYDFAKPYRHRDPSNPSIGAEHHAPDPTTELPSVRAPESSSVSPMTASPDGLRDADFVATWATTAVFAWVTGFVLCLIKILRDQVSIVRILHRGKKIRDASWNEMADSAARTLRLKKTVELLRLNEALSPMITGILHPVILLPANAEEWEPARRQLVLLHEMAHAKRNDLLSQLMAQLACSIYWFNPIAWYGLSQLRKYRELACDDLVLESGQRPSDYAHVLLDVARTGRHRQLVTAVGMARSSDVENRITALLDGVRSHVSLTKRSARSLLALTMLIVALIGSMRLQSQAKQPAASDQKAETKIAESAKPSDESKHENAVVASDGASKLRTMTINVRDENNEPLNGVNIHVGVWEFGDDETVPRNQDYVTGDDGSVEVKIPTKLMILRLWATQSKYVPMFFGFEQTEHENGRLIPPQFDFVLPKGTQLGGTVVDEAGRPIPGVGVWLDAKPVDLVTEKPLAKITKTPRVSWLTDWDHPPLTDENGKWEIDNAPAKTSEADYRFELRLTHDVGRAWVCSSTSNDSRAR